MLDEMIDDILDDTVGDTRRSFRVSDELWDAAMTKAHADDMTVSQLIRRFLTAYVEN